MDHHRFDSLARLVWTRQSRRTALGTLFGAALVRPSLHVAAAKPSPRDTRQRRRKRRKRRLPERQYPVFATCYTPDGEHGPIPGGPHPTCESPLAAEAFAPCDTALTLAEIRASCDAAYPACGGHCRIKADPIVGLGDCPNFTDCVVTNGPQQPIPHGPYASCWSWPDFKCETCPNEKPDYQGLKDLCGQAYPPGQPITCWDRLGRNDCYPIGCDVC